MRIIYYYNNIIESRKLKLYFLIALSTIMDKDYLIDILNIPDDHDNYCEYITNHLNVLFIDIGCHINDDILDIIFKYVCGWIRDDLIRDCLTGVRTPSVHESLDIVSPEITKITIQTEEEDTLIDNESIQMLFSMQMDGTKIKFTDKNIYKVGKHAVRFLCQPVTYLRYDWCNVNEIRIYIE